MSVWDLCRGYGLRILLLILLFRQWLSKWKKIFCLLLTVGTRKQVIMRSQNSLKSRCFLIFLLIDGRVLIQIFTNNYGSGYWRPKNLRIRNNALLHFLGKKKNRIQDLEHCFPLCSSWVCNRSYKWTEFFEQNALWCDFKFFYFIF